MVKGEKIEEVKVMKYLGAMFNEEGSCEDEVDSRIGLTCRTIGALRKEVVDRKELSKTTKLRVYNAIVKPTLLYGSDTWTLQNRHMKKLQATEMRYLRKVEGVTRMDRMRSDDIRERLTLLKLRCDDHTNYHSHRRCDRSHCSFSVTITPSPPFALLCNHARSHFSLREGNAWVS